MNVAHCLYCIILCQISQRIFYQHPWQFGRKRQQSHPIFSRGGQRWSRQGVHWGQVYLCPFHIVLGVQATCLDHNGRGSTRLQSWDCAWIFEYPALVSKYMAFNWQQGTSYSAPLEWMRHNPADLQDIEMYQNVVPLSNPRHEWHGGVSGKRNNSRYNCGRSKGGQVQVPPLTWLNPDSS